MLNYLRKDLSENLGVPATGFEITNFMQLIVAFCHPYNGEDWEADRARSRRHAAPGCVTCVLTILASV